jgi:hypothetical protein
MDQGKSPEEKPPASAHATLCRDEAYGYLWKAIERPGSSRLTALWVDHDPDLEALRGVSDAENKRYQQLLTRLRDSEEKPSAPLT